MTKQRWRLGVSCMRIVLVLLLVTREEEEESSWYYYIVAAAAPPSYRQEPASRASRKAPQADLLSRYLPYMLREPTHILGGATECSCASGGCVMGGTPTLWHSVVAVAAAAVAAVKQSWKAFCSSPERSEKKQAVAVPCGKPRRKLINVLRREDRNTRRSSFPSSSATEQPRPEAGV
ncbi:hypothetical protein E2C01_034998 [Portunus trituberculatus]|uniref:Secreted protein n=1 Tax=Portunus trituberculatus TaxID=210409 RepID=A0A5B7F8H2_PORTR|nr:hypothetical protein [Portunus trituberculatus]